MTEVEASTEKIVISASKMFAKVLSHKTIKIMNPTWRHEEKKSYLPAWKMTFLVELVQGLGEKNFKNDLLTVMIGKNIEYDNNFLEYGGNMTETFKKNVC